MFGLGDWVDGNKNKQKSLVCGGGTCSLISNDVVVKCVSDLHIAWFEEVTTWCGDHHYARNTLTLAN